MQRRRTQIDVRAPAGVRAGESFQATVDIDTASGVERLAFTLNFNNTILQLLGSSTGTFVQDAGIPARLDVQEPSDGVVLVSLDVQNALAISGSGSVVMLQFRATNAGTTLVSVDDVALVEKDRTDPPVPTVRPGRVTVE